MIKLTYYIIFFQTFCRGFMPLPFLDLRIISLALISSCLFCSKLKLSNKSNLNKYLILYFLFLNIYACISYFSHPLAPFSFFFRRFLQLFYLTAIIAFFYLFYSPSKRKIITSAISLSFYALIISQALQGIGIPIATLTFYPYTGKSHFVTWINTLTIERYSGFAFDPNLTCIYIGAIFFLIPKLRLTSFLSILASFSRGGLLALFITYSIEKINRTPFFIVLFFLLLAFSIPLLVFVLQPQLDESNSNRLLFWMLAIQSIYYSPFSGVGFSNIGHFFIDNGLWFASVHNTPLHICAELGILAVLPLILYFSLTIFYLLSSKLNKIYAYTLIYIIITLLFVSEPFDPLLYIIAVIANQDYCYERKKNLPHY